MDIFDALPPVVRRAIASAAFPFPPRVVSRMLRRGYAAERVAATILSAGQRLAGDAR